MVVDNASSLFELLNQFDPNNPKHFDILEELKARPTRSAKNTVRIPKSQARASSSG